MNIHGALRANRLDAASTFRYTSDIVVPVNSSTIGYFKSVASLLMSTLSFKSGGGVPSCPDPATTSFQRSHVLLDRSVDIGPCAHALKIDLNRRLHAPSPVDGLRGYQ